MRPIRVVLIGFPRMLNDIIRRTIASERDIRVVESDPHPREDLGDYTRRRRVDVVIYAARLPAFTRERVKDLLRENPRLGLLEMDGPHDAGALHHLTQTTRRIQPLGAPLFLKAVRAGAALRRA